MKYGLRHVSWGFFCFFCVQSSIAGSIIEKKIVVMVASYNNALYYQKNLDSIFSQNYSNYRVIYIDDCSTDGTGTLVNEYVNQRNLHEKIKIIINQYNRKKLANFYSAVHSFCEDDELIVELDGDDAFAHDHVLSMLNQLYTDKDIWFAYGQYINVPESAAEEEGIPVMGYAAPTPDEVIEQKLFRKNQWIWSGTRTFYAWIFKKIQLAPLIFEGEPYFGKFFPAMADGGIIFPMMEMAGTRIYHIPDVIMHRTITPINDFKINKKLQKAVDRQLKSSPIYDVLTVRPESEQIKGIDCCLFSENNPLKMAWFLREWSTWLSCDHMMLYVLYTSSSTTEYGYDALRKQFPDIIFVKIDEGSVGRVLSSIIKEGKHEYLLLCEGIGTFSAPIDLDYCVKHLSQTYANAWILDTGIEDACGIQQTTSPCEWLYDEVYAAKYCCIPDISILDKSHVACYEKKALIGRIKELEAAMMKKKSIKLIKACIYQKNNVALFFKEPKIILSS